MTVPPVQNRDPLILRQTLLDLAARLRTATASGCMEQQGAALNHIFHTLVMLGVDEDKKLSHPVINLALAVQRAALRTDLANLEKESEISRNELTKALKKCAETLQTKEIIAFSAITDFGKDAVLKKIRDAIDHKPTQ